MRSSVGISKLPVSEEIDPGFGPDTEQRRVEFAAKLEEEAFSISFGDATKIARKNLITALRLWSKKKYIKLVSDLKLEDILFIWLIFDVTVLVEVFESIKISKREEIAGSEKIWEKYVKNILKSLKEDVKSKILNIKLDKEKINEIRENYGGDLVFSLRNRNFEEIMKIYEMTYNKLSQSLRDKFIEMIYLLSIDFDDLKQMLLKKSSILNEFLKLLIDSIDEKFKYIFENLEYISKIVSAFSIDAGKYLNSFQEKDNSETKNESVKEKVKKYYGIE